jgi:GMP synthase-like glutamine amidotransferase
MKTLIVDNHTKHIQELGSLFSNPYIIQKEDLKEHSDFRECALIIFSGGSSVPTVLEHPEEYAVEIAVIKNSAVPIIGICLGAEIITEAFGGKLVDLKTKHRGFVRLEIEDDRLQTLIRSHTLEVFEGHRIGIERLPEDFVSCAHSEHGVEILKHKTRPIIGFQFHPEVSKNIEMLQWIIETLNIEPSGLS